MNNEDNKLKWRFDISTFRLIGRDLITDRITALFELVKNCYDANSKRVDVIFENVSLINGIKDPHSNEIKVNSLGKITIKDDGFGMSFTDIRDKWMVIGTSNKRKNPFTPEPFLRRCVGEKGIGRFAVDKLGNKVNIITKKGEESVWLNVEIDWGKYYNDSQDNFQQEVDKDNIKIEDINKINGTNILNHNEQIILFTDIENSYSFLENYCDKDSGTTLEITSIREFWTKEDIIRFCKEANKIVSPYKSLFPPFDIYISAKEYDYNELLIKPEKVDFSTLEEFITYNSKINIQESLFFNKETEQIEKKEIPIKIFGGISLKLFYFDENARKKYHRIYKDDRNRIDGIKIYRDGIIATPFAETEANPDKKRDILGIDKRLWQDVFNRISTREIIGILDISKSENSKIIDSTNRQDFIDNEEYRELKEFIIHQLSAFEDWKIHKRIKKKALASEELKTAKNDVDNFANAVNLVVESNPTLRKDLAPLIEQAKKTSITVKNAIKEQKEAEKEYIRKENMYLSIMSLQEYAIHIAHAVRTSLGKIQTKADFFYRYYPDPEEEQYFKLYAKEIYEEMLILDKVINFMLSYSQSNLSFENIKIKELIENLFNSYRTVFTTEKIKPIIDVAENLEVYSNKQFFNDIFQNIISNSIKALLDKDDKIIKCTGYASDNNLILLFSDNGLGIPKDKKEWVFGVFNTTTEETGGAGIGLYVVKTRVESLKGTVEVIDSEFGNTGTTIKISLPFKK